MPLAIELAATWVRTLSCDEIAREIERGMAFLTGSARDLPARHRSVRSVFDHSWKRLAQEEQEVLLRLSVFRGGFGRDAAEQVAEAKLSLLSAFVTKSLVRRGSGGRYELHELIRQFAAETFATRPQEQAATRARHGRYYFTYFARADVSLRGAPQRETIVELTAEMDNFRSAWDWALAGSEFALIEQAMRTFGMFFDTRGWLREGLAMLDCALDALEKARGHSPAERSDRVALGHMLVARSLLATRLGHNEQATAMFERSLAILRPLDEPRVLAEALAFFGNVLEFTGDHGRASEMYSEGLEVATAIGDRWFAALCKLCLAGEGSLRVPGGNPETSLERLRSVVAEWRLIGDPRLTAIALNNLAWVAVRLGRFDEARAALLESVSLSNSIGDRWGLGFTYRGLGLIAQAQMEHPQAVEMLGKSRMTFREVGARQDEARVLVEMSRSLFALGSDADAETGWRDALRITLETQSTFVTLEALAGLASLHAKRGHADHALELLSVVLNHPASLQETKDRAEKLLAELEPRWASSRSYPVPAHTFEEVVAHALASLAPAATTDPLQHRTAQPPFQSP